MASETISLSDIRSALDYARSAAEREWRIARGIEDDRRARWAKETVARADREFQKLTRVWSRCESLLREAERAYDRHVLTPSAREGREPTEDRAHD